MRRRHFALPRIWLLTDERQGESLWLALEQLPRGAGIVVRHYSLPRHERDQLFGRIRAIGKRRGWVVAYACAMADARRLSADAVYGKNGRGTLPWLCPVHNHREIAAAERAGADLLLLSPVFVTRSHHGGKALGAVRFGLLARTARRPVIALGGMTSKRARQLTALGADGYAAIDAWIRT